MPDATVWNAAEQEGTAMAAEDRGRPRARGGRPLVAVAAWLGSLSSAAYAGPPFLTDDPEPTDRSHFEIYAPLVDASGRGGEFEGSAGAEINYGAAEDVQVTFGLPIAFAHDRTGWSSGRGDLEVSVKYRFVHIPRAGLSIAAFPGLTVPTARRGLGNPKVTVLVPVWAQKDFRQWSVFGGGGYAINPGAGQRDFLTGGVAVTRQVSEHVLVGVEADWQGADAFDAHAATSLGAGGSVALGGPFRLLGSAGPTFTDGAGRAGFHGFVALGLDL